MLPVLILGAGQSIDVSSSSDVCAFAISAAAEVNLTLKGENTLKSSINEAGLNVPEGAILTITKESNGSLSATGYNGAGIGGGVGGNGGTVTISGGTVTATSNNGAGIGGGTGGSGGDGNGGTMTISGGTVTATSYNGAGIGGGTGGSGGDGGTVTVSGGTVNATSTNGAGIGGSSGGSSGTLKNAENKDVYLVTLTLDGAVADTPIESLAAGEYAYGMNDVKTIDDKLYFYLPQDTTVFGVITGEDTPRTFINNGGTLEEASVTIRPSSANVYVGDPVTLTATAINMPNPSYTWYKVIGVVETPVFGATTSTYTPPTDDVGTISYLCLVYSGDHPEITAFSKLIQVTVSPLPTYAVTLPSGTGYTAAADGTSTSPTTKGGDYSFTLTIDSNYEKGTGFAVKANNTVLMPSGDVYTIENITSAQTVTVEGIVMKPANYSAVDTAIASIPTDLTLYTEETANAVTTAKNAVERGKKIDEQSTVDGYATAIEDAVAALQYKDADYSKVDAAISKIPADLSVYTDETAKAVNDAKNAVIRGKKIDEQSTVDGYATAIEDAVAALKYKGADYSKVDAAIAKIPADLSVYTDETAKAVSDAKDAVIRGKKIDEQSTVNGYATAIKNAVDALEYKPADYSKVDEALGNIPSDLSSYTVETAKAVNDAKESVIRDKNITEQATVNGYAAAINNAVSSLEKKKAKPVSPQTGDNSNMVLWIALLFISGSAATVLGISQKRKKAK